MSYKYKEVAELAEQLAAEFEQLEDKAVVLKDKRLGSLMAGIKDQPADQRAAYGQEVNRLKEDLHTKVAEWKAAKSYVAKPDIDVTAPFHLNQEPIQLPNTHLGSMNPLMTAQAEILDVFYRMGFTAVESRQLDNAYYMFDSLNFPEGHPARDEYDTFILEQTDSEGEPLLAPAHTSVMQNRVLMQYRDNLDNDEPIAVVIPGRTFRNEDVDARHEHTFYQIEGVYVSRDANVANLIASLKAFMTDYYGKEVDIKTQPFYFPFTEPSFEMAISCPFCDKQGCKVCGEGWIELLGCGMIHPNVLKEAGIDPNEYTGFAWGIGFMRMAMIKYDIEDVRHFQSGKLEFLRQFA
ncbi:MAG: phenylalanine--tRNA ligase subunit alpha [Patescibacteria group bacterium]